jgi:hypothetical protein
MGRPSKLTPELQERIVGLVREGNYIEIACEACGFHQSQYYRWLNIGENAKDGIYREFYEAVTRARAEAETELLAMVKRNAPQNPEDAKWILERSRWQRWGKRTIALKPDIPVEEAQSEEVLEDALFDEMLDEDPELEQRLIAFTKDLRKRKEALSR